MLTAGTGDEGTGTGVTLRTVFRALGLGGSDRPEGPPRLRLPSLGQRVHGGERGGRPMAADPVPPGIFPGLFPPRSWGRDWHRLPHAGQSGAQRRPAPRLPLAFS